MQPFESGRTLPARSLDFWFDYTCPYAYLASTQAPALAERMGVPLTYQPFLLGGVFKALGMPENLGATLAPAKAAHNLDDMQRWAKRFGVPLHMPDRHPMRSVDALRATIAAGLDPAVVAAFYRLYWVDGIDIADRMVITKVVTACGHDAAAILTVMDGEALAQDLRSRTDRALELGIFGAPAWVVDGAHLYWGQDRIAFVEGRPWEPSAVPPPSSPRSLEVYWDFSSPFAYLGVTQVKALAARTGARVTWRPMLLGGIFRALGGPDVPLATFSPAKARYVAADLERWAAYWGVPFRMPTRFPTSSVKALRLHEALPESARDDYRANVFRAYWAEDQDITDPEVLLACAGGGPVGAEALARVDTPEIKNAIRAHTDHALAQGVFGAPTFVVDGRELFWGQDRLTLVEDALRG
ncbi:MAG: 2-hydroxychromene-2-carboxylate isomerase [Labilithrix sp.]|nr:2-hydroxychromene-2-carboxylate isomerase [Labilithrix sp.]